MITFTMQINDEIVVPYWAKWMAQDKSGVWYWYSLKPFVRPAGWWASPNGVSEIAYKSTPATDWKKTLYKVIKQ